MRHQTNLSRFILSAVAALLLAIAIPSTSFAQGRGNGRGHNKEGDWSNRVERNSTRDWQNRTNWQNRTGRDRHFDKKCGKFVNCHDARAGRIDGRGPRGTRVGNLVWRNRFRNRNTNDMWRYRNRRTVRRVYENR